MGNRTDITGGWEWGSEWGVVMGTQEGSGCGGWSERVQGDTIRIRGHLWNQQET